MKSETANRMQRIAGAGAVAVVAAITGYSLRDSAVAQGTSALRQDGLSAASPVVNTAAVESAVSMQNAFSQVAHAAEPAVVTITISERQRPISQRGGMSRFFGQPGQGGSSDPFDEFMRRFQQSTPNGGDDNSGGNDGFAPNSFRSGDKASVRPIQDRAPRQGGQANQGPLVETGLGSGFIYDKSGLILTNAHVVEHADRVTVKMLDGRTFKDAKVLGIDEKTDIAVVKIPVTNAPSVTLGDSSKVDVGDWAIAVGNPFGLSNTLTVGVISATAREVDMPSQSLNNYLQTDASINSGNSGGPLLDIYGHVVGINNAIYSRTGGSVGIGFAIPVNIARHVAEEIVKTGHVRRASIGVQMTNVDDANAGAFGLPADTKGAIVQGVLPDTPAARAGVQVGDVITAWNGDAVTKSVDLQRSVTSSPIGMSATMKVLRNGRSIDLTVTPTEMKEDRPASVLPVSAKPVPEQTYSDSLGLRLTTLDDQTRAEFEIPTSIASGVVVGNVQQNGPAASVGLQSGDVIQKVGQESVSTPADVSRLKTQLLQKETSDTKSVAIYVQHNTGNGYQGGYVVIPIGE